MIASISLVATKSKNEDISIFLILFIFQLSSERRKGKCIKIAMCRRKKTVIKRGKKCKQERLFYVKCQNLKNILFLLQEANRSFIRQENIRVTIRWKKIGNL